jgi:hypothetical protein
MWDVPSLTDAVAANDRARAAKRAAPPTALSTRGSVLRDAAVDSPTELFARARLAEIERALIHPQLCEAEAMQPNEPDPAPLPPIDDGAAWQAFLAVAALALLLLGLAI